MFNNVEMNALDGRMTRHRNGVVSDVEEVQFDGAKQAELVWGLSLELLRCLEPVHKLSHLLAAVCSGADAVYHLHLNSSNAQRIS